MSIQEYNNLVLARRQSLEPNRPVTDMRELENLIFLVIDGDFWRIVKANKLWPKLHLLQCLFGLFRPSLKVSEKKKKIKKEETNTYYTCVALRAAGKNNLRKGHRSYTKWRCNLTDLESCIYCICSWCPCHLIPGMCHSDMMTMDLFTRAWYFCCRKQVRRVTMA